jgi:hypothetical protein
VLNPRNISWGLWMERADFMLVFHHILEKKEGGMRGLYRYEDNRICPCYDLFCDRRALGECEDYRWMWIV